MRGSGSSSARLKLGNDPYGLLRSYAKESKILSKAYHMSECYYRSMYKYFNYPVVVLSTCTSVCAGLNLNEYVIMGLSFSTLILLGFDKLIDPKDKEFQANKFSVEYGEINSNVKQFILSNDRTRDEVKAYSETVYSLFNKWKSFNPPIKDKFVTSAKLQHAEKLRPHKMTVNASPKSVVVPIDKRNSVHYPDVEKKSISPITVDISPENSG